MRISIWQQFSSNHSSDFTIVGKFRSNEEAHTAADKLNTVIDKLKDWWRENQSDDLAKKLEAGELSIPEQQLSGEYDISWPQSIVQGLISWYRSIPVQAVKQYVFVQSGEVTFGPQPFSE